jgi:TPR repeat protein
MELFKKAAAKGHSGAMFALGALFAGGHDLPFDRKIAQQWFRGAAELGHGHAQLMLGRYLTTGLAGELNHAEGRLWLERAAAQGVADALAEVEASSENPATELIH